MFFSENKLRQLANLNQNISTDQIIDAINCIGFEVESINKFNKNEKIKFGQVLSVEKNPNSDKLTICNIKFNDKNRTIQTTAKNVKTGDFLIACVPGSKINGIEIKEKEMANIISEGMLMSFSELGFNSSLLTKKINEGILIIDPIDDLNLDPIKYFDLEDNIIEVSILSNRSDALSYQIFAQELAAYFQTKVDNELIKENKSNLNSSIKIETNDENKLNGIEVTNESEFKLSIPDLMLLLKSNIKLDDNELINFSNLTMINTGVSLRVFDSEKIGNKISIKLENQLTYLNDGKDNISLLGVEENKDCIANNNSKKIFFEFSQINQKTIRNNSKISKKVTNSSINNSRIISSGLILITKNFISNYFKNHSNLLNSVDTELIEINFDKKYLNNYAGFEITENSKYKNAIKSLEILNFQFKENKVLIPNTRHDIKNMQNIVEEIFRFYGLNNFEPKQIPLKPTIYSEIETIEKNISALGYTQAWTYTLINKEKNEFNPFNFNETKNLKTFVSEEYNSIRNSIAIPLLNVFEYNKKRKMENASFFDTGMINDRNSIIIASNQKTYSQIKNDIEKIAKQKFEIRRLDNSFLHPNYNAGLFLGQMMVGWIGKFNPFKYDSDVIFAEILKDCIYKGHNKFLEFDSNQLKERDITLEIEKDYENEIYLKKIKGIDGIFSIKLISTFKKDKINKITYKILMNEKALEEFEKINWENKKEIIDF